MPVTTAHSRILEIEFTIDQSDDDIETIDNVIFWRSRQSFDDSNDPGYVVNNVEAYGDNGNGGVLGTSIGDNEVDIYLPETLPPPTVIRFDVATTA